MTGKGAPTVALLYPGDRAMRQRADPGESRFAALFDAFAAHGVRALPAVYHDDLADDVEAQLRTVDAVLVWCNPIEAGQRRERLDALLAEVARQGVFVSTHPDTVRRLGTKDVLFDTRQLPFGSDVHRVESLEQLDRDLPERLRSGPRVLKQQRGQSGVGIWRVELASGGDTGSPDVRLHQAARGAEEVRVDWAALRRTLAPYFEPANGGHLIDQAWQPRLAEGMVRAYLVEDQVTGFGHQAVNALYPSVPGAPPVPAGPRLYFDAEEPQFGSLKQRLESGWIESLCRCLSVQRDELPMLWDCDFLLGEAAPGQPERFVLCEINVCSVSPFPPSSTLPLVLAVKNRLLARRARTGR
ncbi:MAG: Cj0069 family protein [Caldimonas sp.]